MVITGGHFLNGYPLLSIDSVLDGSTGGHFLHGYPLLSIGSVLDGHHRSGLFIWLSIVIDWLCFR